VTHRAKEKRSYRRLRIEKQLMLGALLFFVEIIFIKGFEDETNPQT
jgi:hypothetical protein